MTYRSIAFFGIALGLLLLSRSVLADDTVPEIHLTLANHAFVPTELAVPVHQKIKLIVTNKDATSAEFESADLSREKVVPANGEIYVYLDPLDPGVYVFFDDFHRQTATGKLIAQ